jgi:ATP-dependent Clp protease ATP-binding subunit ClpB
MNNCGLSHIVNVEIDDSAISGVAAARFAPLFGAIPLKRTIQSPLEKPLAKAILKGHCAAGDTIRVA